MSNKKLISGITVICFAIIAAIYFLFGSKTSSSRTSKLTASPSNVVSESQNDTAEISNKNSTQETIGNAWQWNINKDGASDNEIDTSSTNVEADIAPTQNSTDSAALPFTQQSVYDALQAVRLDAGGNIVLDHDALISLDEALERIYSRLDTDSLAALQALIIQSLPGIAGEQTAQIVNDYAHFLVAKDEFSELNENTLPEGNEQTLESLNNDQLLYGELKSLREIYLGKEATDQLFVISDANAHFMFESLKLDADQTLTIEDKQQKLQEIEATHTEQSINITNWTERYADFLNRKNTIVEAAVSDDDKRNQLTELLQQLFDEDERSRILHLELDNI